MFTTSAMRTGTGVVAIVLLTATPALALGSFLRTSGPLTDFAPATAGPAAHAASAPRPADQAKAAPRPTDQTPYGDGHAAAVVLDALGV